MALPRRASRTIVVDTIRYRWMSELPDDMVRREKRTVSFVVQRDGGAGARLRATVRWEPVVERYRTQGKMLSHRFDRVPPFVVAQTIRLAIRDGWSHAAAGPEYDAGFVEGRIDWDELAPE